MNPHNPQNPHNPLTKPFSAGSWPCETSANPHNHQLPMVCEVVREFRPGCARTRYMVLTSMFWSCAGSAGCAVCERTCKAAP
jgi:hypothetical protein